ncbi:transcription initiation factor TFIID subunit 11 [Aphidius gifuensis]|uniref:transcription initiation factor TFIID subunit 11 n=1 Tax=Aphidius gifuensis TaxID=684658 RepID=UPI001CDCAF20|nr:transcription initiation factor TFIID subunit 11 [Aphidius gifuensis]
MDNLFGKDDSGNDSDLNNLDNSKDKSMNDSKDDSIEIDEHDIKQELSSSENEHNVDLNRSMSIEDSDVTLPLDKPTKLSTMNLDNSHDDDLFDTEMSLSKLPEPQIIKDRRESKEKNKRELEEEEREKMQVLVSNFTENQLDRYEMFRRSAFPKASVKRIMQTITGCSVSQNVVIAMSGIAKVFVGEIVEEGLDVEEAAGDTGPLQPKHLREAVRRLRLQGQIPTSRSRKAFLRL